MPGPADRREAVSAYFSADARSWRDRYEGGGFDAYNYQARASRADAWLRRLRQEGSRDLLDLGCGAGVQARAAADAGWSVVGADLSPRMLEQARRRLPQGRWVAASVEEPPFPPASFDAVLMLGVIGYVQDPAAALAAAQRLLRPGGHLIISWASPPPLLLERVGRAVSAVPDAVYLALKRALLGATPAPPAEASSFFTTYNRFWGERAFCELLRAQGLAVREVAAVNYGAFRFMDRRLWPERVDIALSRALERLGDRPSLAALRERARTHVAWASVAAPGA